MKSTVNIDLVLRAVADKTRRQVVERLSNGPASVSELAEPFSLAMPSFLQHLDVLEHSGLIQTKKVGRVRTCYLETEPLIAVEDWLSKQRKMWNARLNQLDDYLLKMKGRKK